MTLSEKDGFEKQNFNGIPTPVIKDVYGNLYFPADRTWSKGFDLVSPDKFRENYPSSSAYLRSVEVNETPFPIPTGLNNLRELKLKYFQNNISIETGIIDYYSQGTSGIRYKLQGLNNNWQYAPANYTIRYDGLPPGEYTLMMQASNAANNFNGPVKSISIQITSPFWNTWWFISFVIITIAAGVCVLFQFQLKQKMKVLNVRQKLHRDLHDDVGATLSSIKIYSEVLQNNGGNGLISGLIKTNAEDMIDKLEIIAWATNPQHDTFKSFKELILKHVSSLCHAKNINLNMQSDGLNENTMMPGDVRQNLFLIFKEAINNIIKYSEASECNIRMFTKDHKFYFFISDNGKGFNGTIKGSGNGWKNMKKRAQELNGTIKIISEQNKGTSVDVNLPYPFKIPNFWDNKKTVL